MLYSAVIAYGTYVPFFSTSRAAVFTCSRLSSGTTSPSEDMDIHAREHRRRPNALAFSIFKSISAIARATLLPWRSSRQLRFGLCKKEDVSKSFFKACRGDSPSQRCSRRVPRCRVGTVCVARRVTRTYAPYSRAPRALALRGGEVHAPRISLACTSRASASAIQ